jgi:hypothetical protein
MQDLLANDPEVMAGRNVKDREAIASNRLASLRDSIYELGSSMDDLEQLLIVVKAKRSDLRDLQGRIRDQLKICQEEIGLGAQWGKQDKGPSSSVGVGDMIDDLDSLIEEDKKDNGVQKSATFEVDQALDSIPDNLFDFL